MTIKSKLLKGLLGASALSLVMTGSAFAAGTAAGTPVENTFTLTYEVDNVAQDPIDNVGDETTFTVDRVINLTVASSGDTIVQPNDVNQELVFTVTNTGNDTQDYALTVADVAGSDFVPVEDGVVLEVSLNGGTRTVYDPANPPTLAADDVLTVYVIRDIPSDAADLEEAELSLVAQTLDANTTTPSTEDNDGNSLEGAAENVFADAIGAFDPDQTDPDGYHSDSGSFVVASATLAADKEVIVFSQDGSNCADLTASPATGDQYAVPGACVEYKITAINSGTLAATSITINDDLPINLTMKNAEATVFTYAPADFTKSAEDTDCGPTLGNCNVNLTNATLAAGDTGVITIRALIK